MAQINNKKKYKVTPVITEDLLLGTQLATGKTSNFKVEDLVGIVQERIDIKQAPIQNIKIGEQELDINNFEVVIPNNLSNYNNDMGYESTKDFEPNEYDKIIKIEI